MKAVKDEGFDINAIVEQLPKEEANKKKYQEEGIAKYVTDNLDLYRLEEEKGLISEEYDYVASRTDGNDWRRRGSDKPPGGKIKDNGRRFNTHHSDDSIAKKYGIWERTSWQEIFYRKGDGDYTKTVEWIKENYPDLYKKWKDQSIEEDFKEFKEEIEPEEEDPILPFYLDLDMSEFPRFNELAQTFNRCSHYHNPEFGFIAALAFGSMASNLDFTLGGMYSNLQMDIFAETSIGKQPLIDHLKDAFRFLELDELLAPPEFASDIATYRFMAEFNILLHIEDEAGAAADITNKSKDVYALKLRKFKLLVHSNTGKEMECPVSDARLQKNTRLIIDKPFLTSIKISTPTHFKQMYGANALTDGTLNRSLVFNIPIRPRNTQKGQIPKIDSELEKILWVQEFKSMAGKYKSFREQKQKIIDELEKIQNMISPLEKKELRTEMEVSRLMAIHGERILDDNFNLNSLKGLISEAEKKFIRDRVLLNFLREKEKLTKDQLGKLYESYAGILLPKERFYSDEFKKYLENLKEICNDQYNDKKDKVGIYGRNLMHLSAIALSIAAIENPDSEEKMIKIIDKSKQITNIILQSLEDSIGNKYTGFNILGSSTTIDDLAKAAMKAIDDMIKDPKTHCKTELKNKSTELVKIHKAIMVQRVNRFCRKGNISTKEKRQILMDQGLAELIETGKIKKIKIESFDCYVKNNKERK